MLQVRHTCKNTKIPPRNQAAILAPFLTNTPAQMPATVPKLSSYRDTDEVGGGGGSSVHFGCALPLLGFGEPDRATVVDSNRLCGLNGLTVAVDW